MATTSLARQLKKLAAPQTTILKQDKRKPSLLFDPKEAASLDRDVVYEIGNCNIHFFSPCFPTLCWLPNWLELMPHATYPNNCLTLPFKIVFALDLIKIPCFEFHHIISKH